MEKEATPGSGSLLAPEPSVAPSGGRKLPAMVRALRHRNFQLFFAGQLISLIGTWMQNVAQAWLVYRMTGSSLLLGAVAFANQIPVFLFAPLGGIVADRHNRHRVVIATQGAMMALAFALAALTLTHTVKVWHIFVLAALLGVANSYDIPARQSFLVDMVGKEDLMNAIALNSSMFNGARVVGPAVAGILVAWVGEGWCFFLNAVSYIAVIGGLLLMKLPPWVMPEHPDSALAHMAEGFRFVRRTMPIRALLLLLGLVSLVGMPYAVLMPIFADQILHGGARALGLLMGAAGVGALIGALALAARTQLRGLGSWVAVASLGFGVGLILFSFSRWFWASLLLLVPVGCALMVQMASSNTLIQAMVPDQFRGRVMAVYTMMFLGMAPLGALLAGALAERLGAPLTLALGGVGCMLGAGAFWLHLPSIRVEARQMIVAQGLAGGDPAEEISTTRSVS
jgi:MFS family permease